jgi:hypothetical protein
LELLKLLKIKPEEVILVILGTAFAGSIGAAQVFLSVIPLSLFLVDYSSSLLPQTYILSGIFVFLSGLGFKKIQKGWTFFPTLLFPILISLGSLIPLGLILLLTHEPWISIVLLIWTTVLFAFLSLSLSNFIIQIFSLEEAKRLLGFVEGARALGGILSGLSIPIFAKLIGAKEAFLIAPLIILGSLFILYLVKRFYQSRFESDEPKAKVAKKGVSFGNLQNKAYTLSIFAFAAVATFNLFSLDLLFSTEIKKHFSTAVELASFLGLFSSISSTVTIFIGFFLYGRLLEKVGVITTLFIGPVLVGSLSVILVAIDLIPFFKTAVFTMLLITALVERVLRQAIITVTVGLLFQPLKAEEKSWVQLINKTMIQPLSISAIGILLLGLNYVLGISVLSVSGFIIFISTIGIVAMCIVKRDYVQMLMTSLSKRAIFQPEIVKLDKDTLQVLKTRLNSPFPGEVVYALETIEKDNLTEFQQIILPFIEHAEPDVKKFALSKIEQYRLSSVLEKLRAMAKQESDPAILGLVLLALGSISDLEKEGLSQTPLKKEFLIASIRYGSDGAKKAAMDSVVALAGSKEPSERELATEIICNAPLSEEKRLCPLLIENLTIPVLHTQSVKALKCLDCEKYIIENFNSFSKNTQLQVISLLGRQSLSFLEKMAQDQDPKLSMAAISALKHLEYQVNALQGEWVHKVLQLGSDHLHFLQTILDSLTEAKLLWSLLAREIEILQEKQLFLLSFIYPRKPILTALRGLRGGGKNGVGFAVEILLGILTKQDGETLIEGLSFVPTANGAKKQVKGDQLHKVIDFAPRCHLNMIHSAALYTIGELGLKDLAKELNEAKSNSDPFIEEIRDWSCEKLKNLSSK